MKPNLLFATCALALAMSNVHAASWVMVDSSNQTSLDQSASLTLGETSDAFTHSANPIPGATVDASGFYAYDAGLSPFTLTEGNDTFSADFSHEASGSPDLNFDGKTAQLKLNTLTVLSSTTDAGSTLTGSAALVTFSSQSFQIAPGVDEVAGDPVRVTFNSAFERFNDSRAFLSANFYQFAFNAELCSADFSTCNSVWSESLVGDDVASMSTTFDASYGSVLRVSGSVGLNWPVDLSLPMGEMSALIYGEQTLDFTLSPVPEPKAWMSLLAGVGVVFLLVGRVKRRMI